MHRGCSLAPIVNLFFWADFVFHDTRETYLRGSVHPKLSLPLFFPSFFLTRAGNLGVVGVFPVQSSQKEVFLRRKPMASTSLLKRLFIKHLLLNECLFCVCEREKIDARHDKSFFSTATVGEDFSCIAASYYIKWFDTTQTHTK